MQSTEAQGIIEEAISMVAEMSPQQTDGDWLEEIAALAGPHIKEWDISCAYPWKKWPEREQRFPGTTNQDPGIDVVAVRASDGEHIAIQCKSRQLNAFGQGDSITKDEVADFALASASPFWAERWIVTNGNNPMTGQTQQALSMSANLIKMVNVGNDLLQQRANFTAEECPHCQPNPNEEMRNQTKSCMQDEAVAESVRILKEHEGCYSGGLPPGQARGRIILPCGTGKTRISLRIVEELTPPGELSIVLCPSIALVAQIRREYLQHTAAGVRALAVCSDETAGYNPKKEDSRDTEKDPTADASNVSASEVKGKVTTNSAEIADWIEQGRNEDRINVIFGTYQSSHRIAEALRMTGDKVAVLVADEAHRTAGLRRNHDKEKEQQVRDFTLCHDNGAFPSTYRVYQTATPRVYDFKKKAPADKPGDWIVRSMDDEMIFGVELYRKSYVEAVNNGWLADYRIIALGVNDPDAYAEANRLAGRNSRRGKNALTSTDYLRGLAFALTMGGATQDKGNGDVLIKSCIAFMNTVKKSDDMAKDLQTDAVKQWVQKWLEDNGKNRQAADYTLEHLDAGSNVTAREDAKRKLAESTEEKPYAITNVGIFGEGTDSPSLNAVAFLEPRKSPIDVIQAVGRAMRTAPGKELGYIICPILIPPNADPEQWLSVSSKDEGWQELGQILLALRAHDSRIEDNLSELLYLYIPAEEPETQRTIVAVAVSEEENRRIRYGEHQGPPGEAQKAVERVLEGKSKSTEEFSRIGGVEGYSLPAEESREMGDEKQATSYAVDSTQDKPTDGTGQDAPKLDKPAPIEPTLILTGKNNGDGSMELRMDTVVRAKPKAGEPRGEVDLDKSKAKAKDMINKSEGIRLEHSSRKPRQRRTREEMAEQSAMLMLRLSGMEEHGNAIAMNLLSRSGLTDNRVDRDLNILKSGIKEAAFHLRNDSLSSALDRHFGLDNLKDESRNQQADGCTIAALLMMNAAMLHQRIANGRWLRVVKSLAEVKNSTNVIREMDRAWNDIRAHDFKPVLEPALEVIYAAEATGKLAGLERALRHIAAEAERIAETYADMGADHAGPLFNEVMGNQASDGAYFTRPVAASIAARLTLDACGEQDWQDPTTWEAHKTVDLACGSGTLLAAMLTDMKRRAREQGAGETEIADLQKLAVEETIKGLDINPVSLQLAAAQLTAGNQEVRYRQMGLHLMPYGPQTDNPGQVSAGTLELLGQKAIVSRDHELGLADDRIGSQAVWSERDDAELEDAVAAAKNAHIVIMNPPFTRRAKMGEKFPGNIKKALQSRVDAMEQLLVQNDGALANFVDKNALRPLFTALADRCVEPEQGVVAMIAPLAALCGTSGLQERKVLAQRFHIHTVLTCHLPGQTNMSQNTNINETIIIARRHEGARPPTRVINLDRFPADDAEAADLHECLASCAEGPIANGWGEVSEWPAELMEAGDWSAAIWRSPELAEASARYAIHEDLRSMKQCGVSPYQTGRQLTDSHERATANVPGSSMILSTSGEEGQDRIKANPDEIWAPKNLNESRRQANGGTYPESDKILSKAGYLLVSFRQDNSTARLTAVASNERFVGTGWMPAPGPSPEESKAIAVFMNSTAGRLQLMRNTGMKLTYPTYPPAAYANIRIPDVKDARIREVLAGCWERTKDMEVPQFRDGECEVRRLWDEAVAEALGWDAAGLSRLRHLLHQEPHVRGLGYGQYGDEAEEEGQE